MLRIKAQDNGFLVYGRAHDDSAWNTRVFAKTREGAELVKAACRRKREENDDANAVIDSLLMSGF